MRAKLVNSFSKAFQILSVCQACFKCTTNYAFVRVGFIRFAINYFSNAFQYRIIELRQDFP